jgi:hypothetical protein
MPERSQVVTAPIGVLHRAAGRLFMGVFPIGKTAIAQLGCHGYRKDSIHVYRLRSVQQEQFLQYVNNLHDRPEWFLGFLGPNVNSDTNAVEKGLNNESV